eukprot:463690-Prorocentrum_minimum.AAC.4
MFGSYTKADKLVIRPADRVALGTGKDNERVVVFISVNDDPKLPIGTLVKVRFRQEAWYTVERAGLHTDTGTCDQFTLGPGLFFSDGPKVTFTHTGSGKGLCKSLSSTATKVSPIDIRICPFARVQTCGNSGGSPTLAHPPTTAPYGCPLAI